MASLSSWRDGPAKQAIVEYVEREMPYEGGAENALELARSDNWTVVSMKDDWSTVFAVS
jgi:hypothetical protein